MFYLNCPLVAKVPIGAPSYVLFGTFGRNSLVYADIPAAREEKLKLLVMEVILLARVSLI